MGKLTTNSFATSQFSCAVNFRLSYTRRTSRKIDVSRTFWLAHAHSHIHAKQDDRPALDGFCRERERDASDRLLYLTRCQLTWSNDGRSALGHGSRPPDQRRSNAEPYSAARRCRAYKTCNDTISASVWKWWRFSSGEPFDKYLKRLFRIPNTKSNPQ